MTTTKPPTQQITVRLDDATIARLDELLPAFAKVARDATRSDVLRAAVLLGLENFERDPEAMLREMARVK
jgi:Arc/MetJ-type ribon-helix-helix transcriptional regulator